MGDILVGFRFHPTDQEIIRLLEAKRRDPDFSVHAIIEININEYEPSELTGLSPIQSDETWCSFFCAPNYINADTKRVNRATKTGYWKLTGEGSKIKAKRSNEVIGNKRILVFYERGSGKEEIKTNWVMHQFSMEKSDPLYQKDFVVYRLKKKGDKKRRVSTNAEGRHQKKLRMSTNCEGQPSHHMPVDNGNSVAENTSPESELLVAETPSPESELFVTENTSLESQLPIAENTSPESQLPIAENISPESQLHITKNTSPTETQLLLSNCSVSDPRDDVAENSLPVNPQHLAKSITLDGCNVLDQSSFSPVQSPNNPEPGSSYSGASSIEDDALISPFGIEWGDNIVNTQWFVQGAYPCEEIGHITLPRDLNSSAGFCGWDRSEMDSETFGGWVNSIFDYNTMACVKL